MVESPRPAQPPKQDESWLSSMWNKAKDAGTKAWDWFKTGGWEQILTIGASFLDDERTEHLAYSVESGTLVPAGTVIYAEYLTPTSFPNTSLNDQARNFTYYEFLNSKIHVLGTGSADTASGAIGIFICPDPELEIQFATPAQIENLVRENGGKIVRLDKGQSIPLPTPMANALLFVTGSDQFDLRRSTQGQLFVVAYTDIDFSENNVAVSLEWKAAFGKGTSSLMQPVPLVDAIAALSVGTFNVSYSTTVPFPKQNLNWNVAIQTGQSFFAPGSVVNTNELPLYPGTYRFSGVLQYNVSNTGGTASPSITVQLAYYDQNYSSTAPISNNVIQRTVLPQYDNEGNIPFSFVYSSLSTILLSGVIGVNGMNASGQTALNFVTFNAPFFIVEPIVVYDGGATSTLISNNSNNTVQSYLYAKHHHVSKFAKKHSSKRLEYPAPDYLEDKQKDKDNKEKSLASLSDAQLAAIVRERRLSIPPADGSARS